MAPSNPGLPHLLQQATAAAARLRKALGSGDAEALERAAADVQRLTGDLQAVLAEPPAVSEQDLLVALQAKADNASLADLVVGLLRVVDDEWRVLAQATAAPEYTAAGSRSQAGGWTYRLTAKA